MKLRPRWMWVGTLALMASLCLGDGVKEVEISPDPSDGDQQLFTVRLRPGMTKDCDRVEFECVLHQEFSWAITNEAARTKIHEPAVFVYKRPNGRLVGDLGCFTSLRVPVGLARLQEVYGLTAVQKGVPVSVSRMRISAVAGDARLWTVDVEAKGVHAIAGVTASTNAPSQGAEPSASRPATGGQGTP
jgi:hypothetical protein